ncbi:SsrA-binding [Rhynchospora pubera]|uniref:SsrA-binding n=1 Tax=Rhynchospora pubera TaxID=906938 RepID=A0AAV8GM18_9POAL|nr:SsrA-binding [Rhynchospora pubera]
MGSWVRTITSPFRKACTIFNPRERKTQTVHDHTRSKLHGEVMACSYHDVQVMWSILDKSRISEHSTTS